MKSDTLFMNISSDEVVISDWEMNDFLHRNDVEKTLGPKLVELVHEWLYKNIMVLNWPGWFTNLRVGTLCLNILNAVLESPVSIYDISKIDLYKKVYEKWILPKLWIIYIGQKRNIWLWDFEKNEKIWQYSFDELKEKIESSIFLDEVADKNYYPVWLNKQTKVRILFDWDKLNIDYCGKITTFSLNELVENPSNIITPNYMMDPSITISNSII